MRARRLVTLVALACVAAGLLVGIAAQPALADGPTVTGGGSGFAALEIDQWRADTGRKPYSLKLNYVAQGSSFGRSQYASGTFDFAASDITFQPEDATQFVTGRENYVYVPVSAGGLAFMYNLIDDGGQRITDLRLTRKAVCSIFSYAATRWNDPLITATNPKLNSSSFNREIQVINRIDKAGESFVLMEYCIAAAPDVWANFINRMKGVAGFNNQVFLAGKPSSEWVTFNNNGGGALGADTMANTIVDNATGRDAIGYNAAGYAKVRGNFPVASIENVAGVFIQPDEENVTVALGYATPNPDPKSVGTFVLNFDGPDSRAYFPSTYSYVIAQSSGFDPGRGAVLSSFLCYAVTKGQDIAPSLRYARLSSEIVNISLDAIARIPGAPSRDKCVIKAAAPPPPPVSVAPTTPVAAAGGSTGTPTAAGGTAGTGAGATAGTPGAQVSGAGATAASGDVTGSSTTVASGSGAAAGTASGGSVTTVADVAASAEGSQGASPAGASDSTGTSSTGASLVVTPRPSAPSNRDVLVTLGQGGALSAGGVFLARRRRRVL